MIYRFLLLFLVCISFVSADPYCHTISSYKEFENISKVVDNQRFTKFILDVRDGSITYFDVNTYPMHVNFIYDNKPYSYAQYQEYVKNYSENKPEYVFCYVIHHITTDNWTFSLWEGDMATKEDITACYKKIMESFFLNPHISFQPTSTYQETVARTLENIPVITTDELFRAQPYQMLHKAQAVGILRIGGVDWDEHDIVVLPKLIPDITPVAGIITEQFSTPLSHLSLRARAWNIPHAGIVDASTIACDLNNTWVYFETTSSSYILRPATQEEIEKALQPKQLPTVHLPPVNLSNFEIKPLKAIRRRDASSYGTKAANIAECASGNIRIPDGFAIPFYYYNEHVVACGGHDKILDHPLNKDFLDTAWKMCQPFIADGIFVRSSTNAEDLKGFNGAGLYETVANVQTIVDFEVAIKTVWASIWCPKACKERARFGIDSSTVYGAILVQKSINADIAGVLVTKDIFDEDEDMEVYTINANPGLGLSVVDGISTPEQILYNYDNKGIKILSRASLNEIVVCNESGGTRTIPNPNNGLPVMTDDQVHSLGNSAHQIQRIFRTKEPLDIEWLFKDNTLYILQVRPFIE
ncbi:MAG: hypothetical protein LLF94_04610 [Chlamydiales bacterium]|nr:hypothetical protein [Chlamydiales bacterium]